LIFCIKGDPRPRVYLSLGDEDDDDERAAITQSSGWQVIEHEDAVAGVIEWVAGWWCPN
jgi:hypothetical protein